MGKESKIEWTDATWNPVTGCDKVSPGCKNCYAETLAERFRGTPGHPYEQGFDLRLWPDRLKLPKLWTKPRRIFVNSMSDLFHEQIPLSFIQAVFMAMQKADHHTFQVLTKRPEGMRDLSPLLVWPDHIWAGTSVENEDYLWRVPVLLEVPAKTKFLSLEPLLGPIKGLHQYLDGIDWVIVGGESGPGARHMELEWVREIRDQCKDARVPFFMKQTGSSLSKAMSLKSRKGEDMAEWPNDVQIREFPGGLS